MKKVLMSLFVISAFLLASCGGPTPGKVVEDAMMKINAGEYTEAVDMMAKEDGALTQEEKDKVVALLGLAKSALEEKDGIKSIEILSEEVDESGDKATIKYKTVYGNGDEEEDEAKVVKMDGEWKLLFDN